MSEPSLRRATAADVPALVETVRQGFETYREWAPRGWEPPGLDLHLSGLRGRMAEKGCFCVLAEDRGEVAGQIGTVPALGAPHAGHVWMLFLRERWWGSGLAVTLVAEAERDAAEHGRTELRLQTPSEHARARAFYEREGWTLQGNPHYEPMLGLVLVGYRRPITAP